MPSARRCASHAVGRLCAEVAASHGVHQAALSSVKKRVGTLSARNPGLFGALSGVRSVWGPSSTSMPEVLLAPRRCSFESVFYFARDATPTV